MFSFSTNWALISNLMRNKKKSKTIVLNNMDLVNIALVYHAMFKKVRSGTFASYFIAENSKLTAIISHRFEQLNVSAKQDVKFILALYKSPMLFRILTWQMFLSKNKITANPLIILERLEKHFLFSIRSRMKLFEMFIIDCISCEYKNNASKLMTVSNYKFQTDFIKRLHSRIPLIEPKKNEVIKVDVVIVGSGAGGAVAAAVLSKQGIRVLVVEKGVYKDRRDLSMTEGDSKELFESSGIMRSKHKDLFMLSGKNLGGGSLIGWTSSFPTPNLIRNEWDKHAGLDSLFSSQEFSNSLDVIKKKLNINTFSSFVGKKEKKLVTGLEKIGYNVQLSPRNVEQCRGDKCGFCVFGCNKGNKKSVLETWHREAAEHDTSFCVNTFVKHIDMNNNQAEGVTAIKNGMEFKIKADTVILAAGALATPTILQRSNINLPMIGKNLSIHPMSLIAAKFDEAVYPWKGTPQAIFCDDELFRDSEKFGYLIQSTSIHPGLFLSWMGVSSNDIRNQIIEEFDYWAAATVMIADRGNGRVDAKSEFEYEWKYSLAKSDKDNLRHGIIQLVRSYYHSGAKEIVIMGSPTEHWIRGKEPFEQFLHKLKFRYNSKSTINFGSLHQMGTAKMGTNEKNSVCDQNGLIHGLKNVYVMDGSLLPRSAAVPPEVSIQTVVHMLASKLANNLSKKSKSKKKVGQKQSET